ncbi:uncharacterized protein MONBRDRAFT_13124 [Monosiga brevicollis MX1]|uniref:Uncharacterized protein n=1 Tax=Monosiga brevicollis TaxID=81824 RepID=A9VEC8_MONBE|nr:uncharacterized protein MONBRDRAFT_13124 [Monosiga brevicollis MX1]EDQ84113.1 predicted protein [Monosiga brevicollis MX1]|eukprot:XP_001751076.1 hypothetical protein [Monosiga brevicollis MX1]
MTPAPGPQAARPPSRQQERGEEPRTFRERMARSSYPSFQRDVIAEFSSTLGAAGLGYGYYYSTGNNYFLNRDGFKRIGNPLPGQVDLTDEQYNILVFEHVKELWTRFGSLFEIWFDHGVSADQDQQLAALLKQYQPQVVGFNGQGIMTSPIKFVYHMTVGNNQVLELDFAIDDTGNVPSDASAVYHALGAWTRACYGMPVANMSGNSSSVLLTLPSPATPVDRFILQEDIDFGERVRQWHIDVQVETGDWMPFANGTAIGHKRIVLGSGPSSSLTAARLTVDSAVASPVILAFAAFKPCPDP